MLRRTLLALALVLTIGNGVGTARAADPSDQNVTATLEKMAGASSAEKSKYVADALTEMRAAQRTMQKIAEKSPECVESQLPLVNSLVEVSTFVESEMHRWEAANDSARADTEFRKIVIARSTVQTMLAEVNSCSAGKSPDTQQASSTIEYSGPNDGTDETQSSTDAFVNSQSVQDSPPEVSDFQ